MRGTFPPCCASTAKGVIRMPPPTMVMNARRSITLRSLNDLVGSHQQRLWDRQPQRLRGLQIDDKLELRGLLDGEVAGVRTLQNPVHVGRGAPRQISHVRSI